MEHTTLGEIFQEFIAERAERLTLKGEETTEYKSYQERMMESIQEVSKGIPELDLEMLINNVKEGETPLTRYCYRAGVLDGIRIVGLIKRLENDGLK